MSSRPTLIFFWLLLGLGLTAFATWLQSQYPLPMAGQQLYGIKEKSSQLMWIQDPYNFDVRKVYLLDLKTGKTRAAPFRTLSDYGQRNGRGQRIEIDRKIEVVDDKTGQLLWSGPTPIESAWGLPVLVGDHYLVSVLTDAISIIDLDLLWGQGLTPAKPAENLADVKRIFAAPGAVEQNTAGPPNIVAIEGTDRFLYFHPNASPPHVAVYEVVDGELIKVTSWPTAVTSVITYDKTVLTAAPGGVVEVRSLDDFQLLRTHPFPIGLRSWTSDAMGVAVQGSLFSYADSKLGTTKVARLEDFSSIPELDMPLASFGGALKRDNSRYVILSNSVYFANGFVVYDTVDRRVVLKRAPPVGVQDANIVDGQLVMINEAMGLTVDIIDLQSGQTTQRQPFVWIVYTLPALLLAALVWLIAWIRLTSPWSHYAVPNAVLLAAMFLTPQLVHFVSLGPYRLTVGYAACLLCVAFFAGSAHILYGRQRVLIRLVPLCLMIAALLGIANLYTNEGGKRGLEAFSQLVSLPLRLAIVFSVVTCVVFYGLKLVGFRIKSRITAASLGSESQASILLRDIFLLTAAIAAMVATAAPNRAFLLEFGRNVALAIVSLMLLPSTLLGLISLIRSDRVYRLSSYVAIGLAILLIGDITFHLAIGHLHRHPAFYLSVVVRYLIFLLLATFAFGSLLRPRYVIARGRITAGSD